MGKVMSDAGHQNIVTITWRYAAGQQMVEAFKENFAQTGSGGKIVEELYLPFPQVEFQSLITRIATLRPDAVFSFFAGGGAVKFVKDYAAAGLKDMIPLYGTGLPHRRHARRRRAQTANGIKTTLHYADDLDNPANKAFLAAFKKKTSLDGDVYAVQGYRLGGAARRSASPPSKRRLRARATRCIAAMAPPRSTCRAGRSASPRRTTWCRTSTCARSRAG